MKNKLLALKTSPLFHGISEDELAALIKCIGGSFKTYKKEATIYLVGDFVREIGIIVSGRVHLIKDDARGNSNIISEIRTGDMFAEAVVCGGLGILPVTITVAEDSEVLFIDFQRVVTTCHSSCVFHAVLIRNMIGVFARKNMMLTGKMEHITKRTTREKLLSYLSEQRLLLKSPSFKIPFDRQGLADYLSVDRSALSAEMSRLKSEGLITYRKNHFELLR
jgi:CRP-like cAMP-binding protein